MSRKTEHVIASLCLTLAACGGSPEPLDEPPKEFFRAGLTMGDAAHTPLCYDLGQVAKRYKLGYGLELKWQQLGAEVWKLTMEGVDGRGMPLRWDYTFERAGELVHMTAATQFKGGQSEPVERIPWQQMTQILAMMDSGYQDPLPGCTRVNVAYWRPEEAQ